jgi:hypothetical protein
MNLGPINDSLRQILRDERSKDLIIVGGASILIKRDWLARSNQQTLVETLPPARATEDLDFVLRIEIFSSEQKSHEVRELIDELGYVPQSEFWQFSKDGVPLDFMARQPEGDELHFVKFDKTRVGRRPTSVLHGRTTPEAFAVETLPIRLDVALTNDQDGNDVFSTAVAHPYALLNMKVRAAHDDYLRRQEIGLTKKYGEKHALDVYSIVAAMTRNELSECSLLANQFGDRTTAKEIRSEATVLFSGPTTAGFVQAQQQVRERLDHGIFWDALREALGIR